MDEFTYYEKDSIRNELLSTDTNELLKNENYKIVLQQNEYHSYQVKEE